MAANPIVLVDVVVIDGKRRGIRMIVTSRVWRCNKRAIMTRGDRQARTKEQGGMRDLFSIAVEGMKGPSRAMCGMQEIRRIAVESMIHCARNRDKFPSQWSDVYRPAVHPALSPGHQDPMLHACNLLHDMTHTPYVYLGVDTIIFKVEET